MRISVTVIASLSIYNLLDLELEHVGTVGRHHIPGVPAQQFISLPSFFDQDRFLSLEGRDGSLFSQSVVPLRRLENTVDQHQCPGSYAVL